MLMEHSKKYYQIKEWYDNLMWSKNKVRNAVIKNWITEDEYLQIVGEAFE